MFPFSMKNSQPVDPTVDTKAMREGNDMTSNPPRATLHPLLSQPKAGPTTSTSKASATSHAYQQPLQPESRPHLRRNATGTELGDASTDKSTVALIRRILCPESSTHGSATPQPLQELLPPLTSSNEVDLQLYALIAIIIKEFVYAWYAKITPDHVFVDEVLQLIAHCTRALEQRLRQVDVEQLVLDEIPRLVEAHIISYRTAKQGSDLIPLSHSTREIYHTLNPHPGLSPVPHLLDPKSCSEQNENEVAYRHLLAQGTLATILPTEDLENVCLRTLVGDVLADLILGNEVSGKVCEGWFIWETISKVVSLVRRRNTDRTAEVGDEDRVGSLGASRLERFGLLSAKEDQYEGDSSGGSQSQVSVWLWKMLYAVYIIYVTFRFVVTGLFRAAVFLPEGPARDPVSSPDHSIPIGRSPEMPSWPEKVATRRPVLEFRAFGVLSRLIDIPQRMPWLDGCLSLIQCLILTGPGRLGDTDSIVDRFLRETIQSHVLTPAFLPTLLLAVRTSLFPMNARPHPTSSPDKAASPVSKTLSRSSEQTSALEERPGLDVQSVEASPQPGQQLSPSKAEIAAVKHQCAVDILSSIPRRIARAFFCVTADDITAEADLRLENRRTRSNKGSASNGSRDSDPQQTLKVLSDEIEEFLLLSSIESDILDPFADEYCNKHLIFSIIEIVLVKLLPELSECGITELMEERGMFSRHTE